MPRLRRDREGQDPMRLSVAHDAQPQPVSPILRKLSPASLAAYIIATQAALGHRFDFSALGSILARATDEELLALHRPVRGTR